MTCVYQDEERDTTILFMYMLQLLPFVVVTCYLSSGLHLKMAYSSVGSFSGLCVYVSGQVGVLPFAGCGR